MNKEGFWKIREALGMHTDIRPVPEGDEVVPAVDITFDPNNPTHIINTLYKAGLYNAKRKANSPDKHLPNLKAVGATSDRILFEDLNVT